MSYEIDYKVNMQILKTARFLDELEVVLDFIAKDSFFQSMLFLDKLDIVVYSLIEAPYRCRQSTKSSDVNVRDLVFKGYVIPYRVNREKNQIEIIGMFSENEWEM